MEWAVPYSSVWHTHPAITFTQDPCQYGHTTPSVHPSIYLFIYLFIYLSLPIFMFVISRQEVRGLSHTWFYFTWHLASWLIYCLLECLKGPRGSKMQTPTPLLLPPPPSSSAPLPQSPSWFLPLLSAVTGWLLCPSETGLQVDQGTKVIAETFHEKSTVLDGICKWKDCDQLEFDHVGSATMVICLCWDLIQFILWTRQGKRQGLPDGLTHRQIWDAEEVFTTPDLEEDNSACACFISNHLVSQAW